MIVHVGFKGFQKVGHICFAYDDIVYSYGNYDSDSFHLNQTIGDGIFFTVPLEKYIPNMISAENNSIFEYGIYTTSKQNEMIEKEQKRFVKMAIVGIQRLKKKMGMIVLVNMKWIIQVVCIIVREQSYIRSRGKSIFTGRWVIIVLLLLDLVLGMLGADVLSIRGIISPGTYLDWLQKEYLKKNSPIVFRRIYKEWDSE